jgi:hypothetical protein
VETVALLLFSTTLNPALPLLLSRLPTVPFSNFLSPVPDSSLGPIHALLDPSHLGSLDPYWLLGLSRRLLSLSSRNAECVKLGAESKQTSSLIRLIAKKP